jgi:hypothetical protein
MRITTFRINKVIQMITKRNVLFTACGLVVRDPDYRSVASGSIPGATRFSEKHWVWNGVHSAS